MDLIRGAAVPANYNVALCTADTTPTYDTNVLSDLTEIAAGNGYSTGGVSLESSAVGFTSLVENDTDDRAEMKARNIEITSTGGVIPASGNPARYAAITDNNATVADRIIIFVLDLGSNRTIPDGETMIIENSEFRLQQP